MLLEGEAPVGGHEELFVAYRTRSHVGRKRRARTPCTVAYRLGIVLLLSEVRRRDDVGDGIVRIGWW